MLMFVATECLVSNACNERMNALYNDCPARGVSFVGINSDSTEPAADVEAHAARNGFRFAVYNDAGNLVAGRFGAQVTLGVFVIGRKGLILHHGSIDDAQNPANITTQGLRLALDSALAGQAIAEARRPT